MEAVEFRSSAVNGTIHIPDEYRNDFSTAVRVILIKDSPKTASDHDSAAVISRKLAALDRLAGSLQGVDVSPEEARDERLARQ